MAQYNLPLIGFQRPPKSPAAQQLELAEREEMRLSMLFNVALGPLGLQYRDAVLPIQFRNAADMYASIYDMQLLYANMIVDPKQRASARDLADQHYQSIIRRNNAVLNNNQ
jgi:hypothetical protein